MKRCNCCQKELDLDKFYKSRKNKYYSICINCKTTKINNYRQTSIGKYKKLILDAKRRHLEFKITHDEYLNFFNTPCHYCGDICNGIDRKDNNIGYLLNNIVTCCSTCNFIKHTMQYEAFLIQINKINQYQEKLNGCEKGRNKRD